jgi:hypothetical protein
MCACMDVWAHPKSHSYDWQDCCLTACLTALHVAQLAAEARGTSAHLEAGAAPGHLLHMDCAQVHRMLPMES